MGHHAEFGGRIRGSHEATKARRGEQEAVSIILGRAPRDKPVFKEACRGILRSPHPWLLRVFVSSCEPEFGS